VACIKMCWEHFESCLFVLMACTCSLNRVLMVLPVWPIYSTGQSAHVSWKIRLLLSLSFSYFVGYRLYLIVSVVL
jgi:hypothetical protein